MLAISMWMIKKRMTIFQWQITWTMRCIDGCINTYKFWKCLWNMIHHNILRMSDKSELIETMIWYGTGISGVNHFTGTSGERVGIYNCSLIYRSPLDSPNKGQWHGALMYSLICDRTNGWANNRDAGDFRCDCTYYDGTEMMTMFESIIYAYICD